MGDAESLSNNKVFLTLLELDQVLIAVRVSVRLSHRESGAGAAARKFGRNEKRLLTQIRPQWSNHSINTIEHDSISFPLSNWWLPRWRASTHNLFHLGNDFPSMATQGSGILAASSMLSLTALSMKQKSVVNDGGAGCGKSLIYNQPFGVPYVCRVQRGMHFYEAQGDEIFPTSASATASCTSIPIARDVPNRDYSLVDVGGIQGIDGPCRQIIDMYYKSIIIKNVEQRKIMLALKYNDIAERYALFRDTLTGIVKQFTPEGLALRARQCVCIVVTKVPIGVSRDDLRDCLDTKCTALDEGSQERSIFESVIEQGRFLPFYLGEVNQPVPSSFAGELLDMFDNTGYVEKQYIAQDQPAIPDSLQPTVVNMILECISHFCSSVALADIRNSIAAHQWSNRSHAVLLNNLRSWRAFCRSESADVLTPDEFMRELGRTLQVCVDYENNA